MPYYPSHFEQELALTSFLKNVSNTCILLSSKFQLLTRSLYFRVLKTPDCYRLTQNFAQLVVFLQFSSASRAHLSMAAKIQLLQAILFTYSVESLMKRFLDMAAPISLRKWFIFPFSWSTKLSSSP